MQVGRQRSGAGAESGPGPAVVEQRHRQEPLCGGLCPGASPSLRVWHGLLPPVKEGVGSGHEGHRLPPGARIPGRNKGPRPPWKERPTRPLRAALGVLGRGALSSRTRPGAGRVPGARGGGWRGEPRAKRAGILQWGPLPHTSHCLWGPAEAPAWGQREAGPAAPRAGL